MVAKLQWYSSGMILAVCCAHQFDNATSFSECCYFCDDRLFLCGCWFTANHSPDLARSRGTWLACKCGGTESALVDCQLLIVITSHMFHSKHMRCIYVISNTDVINGRTPERLNLLSMNEVNDHELDELQTIWSQSNCLIA